MKTPAYPQPTPVKTLKRGESLLRDHTGDQLLLKTGDTWTGTFVFWWLSGKSATEPMVLGSYGMAQAHYPVGNPHRLFHRQSFRAQRGSISYASWASISGRMAATPTHRPIPFLPMRPASISCPTARISSIENCEVQDYSVNINFQDYLGPVCKTFQSDGMSLLTPFPPKPTARALCDRSDESEH